MEYLKVFEHKCVRNATLIHCYSLCCNGGCCKWYTTLSVYGSFVVIFVSFWLILVECWLKLHRKTPSLVIPRDSRKYGSNGSVSLQVLPIGMLGHVVVMKK